MKATNERGLRCAVTDNRGFSLVELIVATGITVVLAGILLSASSGILSSWNRSRGKLMSSNQAKLALDQLADDLEGAFFRNDGNTWLAATILENNNSTESTSNSALESQRNWVVSGTDSIAIKPRTLGAGNDPRGFVLDGPAIGDCRFGMAGSWLRFFATKLDDNSTTTSMSAPTAISYQIVRRRVGGSASECVYLLYRSVVRESGTSSSFEVGYNLDPTAGNAYATPSGVEGDPGNVIRPNAAQAIANNVVDFGVRLFVREDGNLRLIFPAQAATVGAPPLGGNPSDSDIVVPAEQLAHLARLPSIIVPSDAYRNRFPNVIEIVVRVLTDEGALLIRNLEAGRISGNWWDIVLANSSVYTRRVEVKGSAL